MVLRLAVFACVQSGIVEICWHLEAWASVVPWCSFELRQEALMSVVLCWWWKLLTLVALPSMGNDFCGSGRPKRGLQSQKKKKRYLCFYCCNKHAICMAQTRCYQHLYVGAYLAGLVYQSSVNCNTKQVYISDLKCIYCFLLGINCEQLLFKSHWKPATALGSEVLYTQYKAYALLLILPCGSTYVPSLPKICFVTYGCPILTSSLGTALAGRFL